MTDRIDVAVIGGGPSGLAAATRLKQRGVSKVVVFEREPEAGGIPRHCGHPPFGMREYKRVLTGPAYARRLVKTAMAAGVEIRTSATVVEARESGELLIATNQGTQTVSANRVIYATGVRETPRSARLISGERLQGVMNTGALQSMVYLANRKPFECPLIVGTELVSFSAIMTCRHAGIKPVAMIEERQQVTARWPSSIYPRLMGIPLHMGMRLIAIEGDGQVSAGILDDADGKQRTIDCDGILLTGKFTPEASLALCGHLAVDPGSGGPLVDQYGRCSDPTYFATGNLLRPVETAVWSWNEGRQSGGWVADDLAGDLPAGEKIVEIVTTDPLISFAMPQKFALPNSAKGMTHLQLRFSHSGTGILTASDGKNILVKKALSVHPERRVLIRIEDLVKRYKTGRIELTFNAT